MMTTRKMTVATDDDLYKLEIERMDLEKRLNVSIDMSLRRVVISQPEMIYPESVEYYVNDLLVERHEYFSTLISYTHTLHCVLEIRKRMTS